jgi:hypothetical protein
MHIFGVLNVYLILSYPYYLTVNVPNIRLLPECGPQLDGLLRPEDDPKFLAFGMLSEYLAQLDFGEYQIIHKIETSARVVWKI